MGKNAVAIANNYKEVGINNLAVLRWAKVQLGHNNIILCHYIEKGLNLLLEYNNIVQCDYASKRARINPFVQPQYNIIIQWCNDHQGVE